MKYKVSQLEETKQDIEELQDWYEDVAGVKSAYRFEGAIAETIASLDIFPEGHPIFDDNPKVRKINMKNHKVAIIYYVDNNVYEVIAVKAFHTLQDPVKTREFLEGRIQKAKEQLNS
jgi:plasmid stabilization system protein ParE